MEISHELTEKIISVLWEANFKVNKGKDPYAEDMTFYNLMVELRELQRLSTLED